MYLVHNTEVEELHNNPDVESTYGRCVMDEYAMLIGRKLCASLDYANVSQSTQHAYFPLSGPFSYALTMEKVDGYVCFHFVFFLSETVFRRYQVTVVL